MKLKKSLILCASFILAITMLFSCKAKNDTTDKNNQSDENTDVVIDENCVWGKGVAPSIILDDHATEQSTADSWLYTLYYNSEVFPTLLPDTAEEANHEITVGRVNRDISNRAYLYLERKFEDLGENISDAEGWLIYTNGNSVAIAYDGHFAYIEAIKYFEENCLQNETFAPQKGVVASDIFITEEYVDEIRETRRETELNALVPGIANVPNGSMSDFYFKNISMNAAHCIYTDTVNGLNFDNVRIKETPNAGQDPENSPDAKIYIVPEYKAN